MGDILKVVALLGLGGFGIGALGDLDISSLQGTGIEGIAGDMQQAVKYIKEDVFTEFQDLMKTIDHARK